MVQSHCTISALGNSTYFWYIFFIILTYFDPLAIIQTGISQNICLYCNSLVVLDSPWSKNSRLSSLIKRPPLTTCDTDEHCGFYSLYILLNSSEPQGPPATQVLTIPVGESHCGLWEPAAARLLEASCCFLLPWHTSRHKQKHTKTCLKSTYVIET